MPSSTPSTDPPFESYSGSEPFIFVSYAHADKKQVYPEIGRLHQVGYRIWYDAGIETGAIWRTAISEAIHNCTLFLVFLSPHAVASGNVKNEITLAIDEGKTLIIVHLEPTTLPRGLNLELRKIQAIQKHEYTTERYHRLLESALPSTLRTIVAEPLTAPAAQTRPNKPAVEQVPNLSAPSPPRESQEVYANVSARPLEPVFLGISVPVTVPPGADFTARLVAYISAFETYLDHHLKELSSRSGFVKGLKQCLWQTGTKVCVHCYGNKLIVESADQEFMWQGAFEVIEFDVTVDAAARGTTVLKFDVSIDGFVIAKMRVDVNIGDATSEHQVVRGTPMRSAFASYASKDRSRVLDRVSEIKRNGVDIFLDCLSLHPGEFWKEKLEAEIKQRQMFLLFWSSNAQKSEWVTWEWQTALKHKGLENIEPHPLDPVTEAPPPQELSALHFDDIHMLVRKAHETAQPSVSDATYPITEDRSER